MPASDGAETDAIVVLLSVKEYAAPLKMSETSCEYFTLAVEAPWFDLEELQAELFVDQYAVDGCFPA